MTVNPKLLTLPVALLIVAVALSLGGCSTAGRSPTATSDHGVHAAHAGAAPLAVVASTDVWGDLAETIGGDKVQVTSIISNPDADPHEYEASARNQLSLARARVVIENGGGYDDFIDRMLTSAHNQAATVLNAVTISGKKPVHGQLNEHVWYDFPTVAKVVDRIQQTYATADPADAVTFRRNAAALKTKINRLEQREAALRRRYAGDPVAITEPVPLYLLDAIGLQNKTPEAFSAAVEDDTDVSARVLEATLRLYSHHQVKLLAYNEQTSGPQTQKVLTAAKHNDIPVVPVTETLPAGKDYIGWMTANLDALQSALSK